MSTQRVIGVDVGGTKVLAGVLERDGTIVRVHERATPVGSQEQVLAVLDAAVEELLGDDVGAVGFGIPSTVDQATGRAYGSVNIPLRDLDFRDRMHDRFGLPVGIDNDGNAAAFAEWVFGAGRDASDLVMLTLGTGVGGGVVIGGKLYRGWAELGHIVIEYDGRPCQGTCTGRGHLESYCTGLAAGEAAQQAFGPDVDAHRLIELAGAGDGRAVAILAEIGRRLGAGIGSLVNIFGPQVAVVGGGFGTAAGELLLGPAREVARREALAPARDSVRIVLAELGNDAGVIGAGLIGFEALDSLGDGGH